MQFSSNTRFLAEEISFSFQLILEFTSQVFLLLFHSYLAENQLPSLPVRDVSEFRILVGHSLHHKSL